jgi:hypothetical protein
MGFGMSRYLSAHHLFARRSELLDELVGHLVLA